MTTRRGFLGAILAAGAAPLIVKAGVLMPIRDTRVLLWADGLHDDTAALQHWINGGDVRFADGFGPGSCLADRQFMTTQTLTVPSFLPRARNIARCQFTSSAEEYFMYVREHRGGEYFQFGDISVFKLGAPRGISLLTQ